MPTELRLLPTRVPLGVDEALDSFLERLTQANDLEPHHILRALRRGGGGPKATLAFFMTAPSITVLARASTLSGVPVERLRNSTLMRFDGGLPLRLDGLDPLHRHSYRNVVAQGWFPRFGTQVCPTCLAHEGIWRAYWRLPIVAVCIHHGTYLLTECTGCSQRIRSHRYSPLRPILGPEQPCGNSISLRQPCTTSLLLLGAEPAGSQALDCAEYVHRALQGHAVHVFGEYTDAPRYLAELRNLATLLLHLGSRSSAESDVWWGEDLRVEARARSTRVRGARWGYSPPQSPVIRAAVLGSAHAILTESDLDSGGERLREWLRFIDDETNGPTAWLVNRTKRTPTMERLIAAASSHRHDVGRRLDRRRHARELSPPAIPQLVDLALYRQLFTGLLGGYEWTGRLYVSLCMVRSIISVANWGEAAVRIGLPPEVGSRNSRAARARMRATPQEFGRSIDRALDAMPANRDFRVLETRVRALASDAASWHPAWCLSTTPARRLDSITYAITWLWCEVAQGCIDTSPAWSAPPHHRVKARYREFRHQLQTEARDSLRRLVLPNSPN